MFVDMHVYMFVGKRLCVGSGCAVELLNMHACVCCFRSLDPKWTLGTQLALMPRSPRKAELDSNVLLAPRL